MLNASLSYYATVKFSVIYSNCDLVMLFRLALTTRLLI